MSWGSNIIWWSHSPIQIVCNIIQVYARHVIVYHSNDFYNHGQITYAEEREIVTITNLPFYYKFTKIENLNYIIGKTKRELFD